MDISIIAPTLVVPLGGRRKTHHQTGRIAEKTSSIRMCGGADGRDFSMINFIRQSNPIIRPSILKRRQVHHSSSLTIFRPPSTEMIALSMYPPAALDSSNTGPKISCWKPARPARHQLCTDLERSTYRLASGVPLYEHLEGVRVLPSRLVSW